MKISTEQLACPITKFHHLTCWTREFLLLAALIFSGFSIPTFADSSVQAVPPMQAMMSQAMSVMTYNIRLGSADDGENHWLVRRDMLFELLRAQHPDLIGLQEALDFQINEIVAALPGYAVVGVGRDDGNIKGEFSAILFRTDRFRVAESGTFWFSDTPNVPGSMTWGNRYPRISSWARFLDRDGFGFYHFNLHLDHESQHSRELSVAMLREWIANRQVRENPVVITGDFNVGEENPALTSLIDTAGKAPFLDSFRVVHPKRKDVGTFSNFRFGNYGTQKIDYLLIEPGTEVLSAEIIRFSRNGRYPSDHFPVTARIKLSATGK